ncbi:MAG: hypothetical protein IJT27_06475 [Clostridia bacterium]|nr:hypothetical protein [Clostridia bacterium]
MKNNLKKLLLTAIVAVLLCFVFCAGALAAIHGDVNGDNVVSAGDARLALRIAVGFDDADVEAHYLPAAADVTEPVGEVNAADARFLLRAAVGLEDLTDCHNWSDPVYENGVTAPTCTEGMVSHSVCAVCGENTTQTLEALGHDYSAASADPAAPIVCARCGKNLSSFNELVNILKADDHYYTGFTKTVETGEIASNPKPELKITLAAKAAAKLAGETLDEDTLMDSFRSEIEQDSEVWDERVSVPRLITDRNYDISGEHTVSRLTAADVSSLTVEEMSGVDFIAALPDSIKFTSSYGGGSFTEDISKTIKAASVGPVVKMTVKVKEEKYTELNKTDAESSLQRIMSYDLRSLAESFNQKEEDDGMLFEMKCNELVSSCTVTYYFDAGTMLPVAAIYDLGVSCNQSINIEMSLAKVKLITGKLRVNISNGSTEYYFFDSLFE